MNATPSAALPVAPFDVYSVHFDFPGGQAIRLRDPVTDLFVGGAPARGETHAPTAAR